MLFAVFRYLSCDLLFSDAHDGQKTFFSLSWVTLGMILN